MVHEEWPAGLGVDLDLPPRGQWVAVAGAVAGRHLHHGRMGGSAHVGSGSARSGRVAGCRHLFAAARSESPARRRRVREAGAGHLYELKEGVTWPERGGSVWK
jgi:hypothetical protein